MGSPLLTQLGQVLPGEGRASSAASRKHVKRQSLLLNEDLKATCLKWLRKTKMEERTVNKIQEHLRDVVIPKALNIRNYRVPERTLMRYMYSWGYAYRKDGQDVY